MQNRGIALAIAVTLIAAIACGDDTTEPVTIGPNTKLVTFKAAMTFGAEVPAPPVASTATGSFTATLDTSTNIFTYDITFSGLTTGVTYLLFAVSRSYYFSLAIMPVIGYSVMRQMASANTTIQMLIPEEYRGRIMALYAMTVVGLGPFGSLAAGALAHHTSARVTMAVGGALALAASGAFAYTLRRDPIAA